MAFIKPIAAVSEDPGCPTNNKAETTWPSSSSRNNDKRTNIPKLPSAPYIVKVKDTCKPKIIPMNKPEMKIIKIDYTPIRYSCLIKIGRFLRGSGLPKTIFNNMHPARLRVEQASIPLGHKDDTLSMINMNILSSLRVFQGIQVSEIPYKNARIWGF